MTTPAQLDALDYITPRMSTQEKRVHALMEQDNGVTTDDVIKRLGFDKSSANRTLSYLRMKGLAEISGQRKSALTGRNQSINVTSDNYMTPGWQPATTWKDKCDAIYELVFDDGLDGGYANSPLGVLEDIRAILAD